MNSNSQDLIRSMTLVAVAMVLSVPTMAQKPAMSANAQNPQETTMQATGSFEVKLAPQGPDEATEGTRLGRMALDKTFAGDLEGTSVGQMLALMTEVEGSGGYVALEIVTGALKGRSGTFVLQHSSTMERGVPKQSIAVVPDSGTGNLEGLSGTMEIIIEGGKHSYVFDYTLPEE